MKRSALVGASILGLILGTTVAVAAQHGHEGKQQAEKQRQHENVHQKNNERSTRHEANGPQRQPVHPEQARSARTHGPRDVWQPHRAQNWKREHRTWRERGGYHGERIPEARFREYFGRGHWFRIHDVPVIVVNGSPRFQYGSYWFTLVDPWPESWSPTWYRTDDVYIDYVNDGYYMYDRRHPGIAVAVSVSF
jgi:hypothetical protein